MDVISDTKEIFGQLASIDGTYGVQTLIETHDAWVHNAAVMVQVTAALRAQLARTPRAEHVMRRIARQRDALAKLVVRMGERGMLAG